ncbi:MAG TPA: ClpX C4-type zinc finger protein [Fimbriimonadaceae bacterium]|nr:ClpX C4-type zinc finger protein [Fimbriimonadaceae bacterium]
MTSSAVAAEDVKECSFCSKTRDKVDHLVVAPSGSSICDECVDLAADMVEKKRSQL